MLLTLQPGNFRTALAWIVSIDDLMEFWNDKAELQGMMIGRNKTWSDADERPLRVKPMNMKRLHQLAFLSRELSLQGRELEPNDINDETWANAASSIQRHEDNKSREHINFQKFPADTSCYVEWTESVMLVAQSNYCPPGTVSLGALIKDEYFDEATCTDDATLKEHRFELEGATFDNLNRTCYLLLARCTKDTPAGALVEEYKSNHDGVGALDAI